jgi:hypothetical protein
MIDHLQPLLILVTVASVLFIVGFLLNRARAKRWNQKAEAEGHATCRDCGHVGTLSYGLLAGRVVTSANIRLVCEACNSENWFVPGGKRDPQRRKGTEIRPA